MKIRTSLRTSQGFTLIEVLVAASLFSVVGMMATSVFMNLSRGQQQISSRSTLYDDAQFILDSLTREISSNAIDYEEYYNQIVIQGKPGMNYGEYASQFYYDVELSKRGCDSNKPSCVNIGANPSSGNFPESDNAFYRPGVYLNQKLFCQNFDPIFTKTKNHACVKQLFLINPDGNKKTLIAPEKIDWSEGGGLAKLSQVLSQAMMVSYDVGGVIIPHLFRCAVDTNCLQTPIIPSVINPVKSGISLTYPDPADLDAPTTKGIDAAYNGGKDFVPFTPSRVNIKNIQFIISPVEDPHKAFAEEPDTGPTKISQPRVTIVLTVEPISNVKSGTNYAPLTVQTTVTPGLFTEVESYPPQMAKNP